MSANEWMDLTMRNMIELQSEEIKQLRTELDELRALYEILKNQKEIELKSKFQVKAIPFRPLTYATMFFSR